jgi:hypothetical protein
MAMMAEFLAELPADEHLILANALGAGLHATRLAAQCMTTPGPRTGTVRQLLDYLATALRELEIAHELVRHRT